LSGGAKKREPVKSGEKAGKNTLEWGNRCVGRSVRNSSWGFSGASTQNKTKKEKNIVEGIKCIEKRRGDGQRKENKRKRLWPREKRTYRVKSTGRWGGPRGSVQEKGGDNRDEKPGIRMP